MTTNIHDLTKRASMPVRQAGGSTVADFFNANRASMAAVLPKHVSPDRMLKIALQAVRTTPALQECTSKSLLGAVIQCATMGLEPNTVLGHAYLVPFNKKSGNEWIKDVQVIIGYKGLIDLARRSGQIDSIAAHVVYANDEFDVSLGTEDRIRHVPFLGGDRGEITAFYAVAKLKGGGHAFEVMSKHQVDAVRDGSKAWQDAVKCKKTGTAPWGAHYPEMGRKTVIRRLAKYLPLSVEFATAAELDALAEAGKPQGLDGVLDGEYSVTPDDAPSAEGEANDASADSERRHPIVFADKIREAASEDEVREWQEAARESLPAEDQAGLAEIAETRIQELSGSEGEPTAAGLFTR